jgi:exopolysaccharide biosynthesis polyprenyl glycosylphosphotransferase
VADTLTLLLAFGFSYAVRFHSQLPFFEEVPLAPQVYIILLAIVLPVWLLAFAVFRLYDFNYLLGGTEEYSRVFNACAVMLALVIIGTFAFPVVRLSRGLLAVTAATAFFLVAFERFGLRRFAYGLRKRGHLTTRTLIVGTNEEARAIAHHFTAAPTAGAELLGFVDEHLSPGTRVEGKLSVLGGLESMPALVDALAIEEIVVSTSALHRTELIRLFQMFGQSSSVELRLSSGLFEIFTTGVHVKEIGAVPLVSMRKFRLDGLEMTLKTIVDYTVSLVGLAVLSPFLLVIALLIKLDSPGPIFHRRTVLGPGERPFGAFKFRTMYVDGDAILARHPELEAELAENHKLKDDPRITRVGAALRKFSLDELPQLINVLLGHMSLVGPRMISPAEGEKYGRWRMNLLTVKPGITGLWQVSGRSDISYEERIRLDMYYIRNYSIWLDLQILLETVPAVLRGRGAY